MNLALLPGLGFDHRIFANLQLPPANILHLNWIDPLSDESIQAYAKRFSLPLGDPAEPWTLIGHSFGGMMAQEIARHRRVDQIILLSSIKSAKENAPVFRTMARLHLHRLFTKKMTIKTFALWAKQHGYETAEEQQLFIDMVEKHSDVYLQWALRQVGNWQGVEGLDTDIVHLHGTADKTFPAKLIQEPVCLLEGGSHIMLCKRAPEVSALIAEILGRRTH
ncbi:MAG: alpha/beta fold hydrolase [Bacteroidota bacterium]